MNKVISIFRPKKLDIQTIESVCKQAYELSCYGDRTAVDVLKAIDTPDTFFIYQCALEAILRNLGA